MKKEDIRKIFFLNILFAILILISGKYLNNNNKFFARNLDESNTNDSYIVIYFNDDCNYKEFYNIYRRNITYIINKETNTKLTSRTALDIHKGFGIEIHFDIIVKNLEYFFSRGLDKNMQYLISVDFTKFDSSLVTKMNNMFYGCNSLESIILSNSDISKVESMELIFYGCSSLQSIDLSNLIATKLNDMSEMFRECKSLKSVNFSNFDCPLLDTMSYIFFGCSSLESIDFTNFHTPKLFDMYNMFYGCTSLKSINLSSFDTSQVSIMNNMFYGCSSLRTIDLSNFDMKSCTSYYDIFSSIDNIKYINLYNFKNDKIISQIFDEAKNIFFVCQKDNIITNPNAYNCCDYNFEADKCDSYQIFTDGYETKTDFPYQGDEYSDTVPITVKSDSDSNESNIGIIIGCIVGAIVVIVTIITIIYIYKKNISIDRKVDKDTNINSKGKTNGNVNITNSPSTGTNSSNIYEYEPEIKNKKKIPIIIKTTNQFEVTIYISTDKTMCELIKYYFEIVGNNNLLNDQSVRFILDSEVIEHNSKKLISDYTRKFISIYGKERDSISILIDDVDNKI